METPKQPYSIDDLSNSQEEDGFFQKLGSSVTEFIETLVVFGAIFAIIFLFVAQPHKVSGNSMVPTLHNGDYILTEKLTYRFREPEREDIIIFKNPQNESQDFVKRILGIPGDRIKITDSSVYINSLRIKEGYLPNGLQTKDGDYLTQNTEVKIGEDQYFVMGDNRSHSLDSRDWGPVSFDKIIGKAFFRYWPLSAAGLLKD